MSHDKKGQVDTETILMTLDQIGQTIDIMTNVVGRLRGYIEQNGESEAPVTKNPPTKPQSHTLH